MPRSFRALVCVLLLWPATHAAADDAVRAFLARHCLECHGPAKSEADLRLDKIAFDLTGVANRERWLAIRQRIEAGEMPPKSKPRPSAQELAPFQKWIGRVAEAQAAQRAAEGRVVRRRLNRVEYENTVCDLLGIKLELKELLPIDSAAGGFDNVGDALHTSSFLLERYLEAADKALSVAIVNSPQPTTVQKRIDLKEERVVKIDTEGVFRKLDDALVMMSSSQWNAITLGQVVPRDRGQYRYRISAYGMQSEGKPVTFRVQGGTMLMGQTSHLVGYFDVPAEKPTIVEFVDHLEKSDTIRLLPHGLATAQQVVKSGGADKHTGPGLAVQWIEIEGPLHDVWPPESHRRIFGDLKQGVVPRPGNRNHLEVVSQDPEADARRVLSAFASRAFRRQVTDDEIAPLLALVKERMAQSYSFEEAVRVGLKGVLVSPEFLFLREKPGKLDDAALANRLSYFLWSTLPDAPLTALVAEKKLSDPQTLRAQVDRMLDDPRSRAFTASFLGQWLGLRDLDFTQPSHLLYPEYDDLLRHSMLRETELFFEELLKRDLSVTNLVASDFTMLNQRLAEHYGISGITGGEFRKVQLPADSHRGGLLTMASVLKVTANGTSTSPVIRGAWVLDRILGTPPPKPPADVAAVEPDVRGATTIREQLAKHRQVAACASCHAKIDPPGFALESFDVIGGWRENYRSTGNGEPVLINGRRMHYLKGKKVDPTGEMADGRAFQDIDGLKQLLLTDREQIARALGKRLVTYATGGEPQQGDQAEVERIVQAIAAKDYGLRTLIHEVVQSSLFQHK